METPKKRSTRAPRAASIATTRTATRTRRTRASATPARPAIAQPTHEAIARRAYDLFVLAGCVHGRDVEFWLTAERELKAAREA